MSPRGPSPHRNSWDLCEEEKFPRSAWPNVVTGTSGRWLGPVRVAMSVLPDCVGSYASHETSAWELARELPRGRRQKPPAEDGAIDAGIFSGRLRTKPGRPRWSGGLQPGVHRDHGGDGGGCGRHGAASRPPRYRRPRSVGDFRARPGAGWVRASRRSPNSLA